MSERIINIIIDSFPKILVSGIMFTIPLTICAFAIGVVFAFVIAIIQYKNIRVLNSFCRFYIWIFRGTPLLVQLFIVFYGLPNVGIVLPPFVAAVIVFSLNEGAYAAESIRAALTSIDRGQLEASLMVGLTYRQSLVRIIIPQALRTVFPVLFNEIISMVKDTSLAANITVAEMFMTTQRIVARTYEPLVLYIEVGVLYLIFSTVLTYVQRKGEAVLSKW